ncbi:hypothetical protein FQN54_003429 [Arachnomyces sp. PD_36]|nr:hypothetical protein FQN54_003429 [Arachnomyces sp. PD_36]
MESGSTPIIKPDPDNKDSPGAMSEDDIYEETGDLDFTGADQDVWLTKIPRFLYENWSKLDDDEEIQIGTVRVEKGPTDIQRVSLRLNEQTDNRDIPKDYALKRQNVGPDQSPFMVTNTFVFTEKDLPGFKRQDDKRSYGRSYLYEQQKRDAKRRENSKKKWEPYARKTISKQTSIAARVRDEFNCLPVENEEYRQITEKKALEALRPKRETKFISDETDKKLQLRHLGPADKSAFTQAAVKPTKARTHENKTARMPQNELLDLIYSCFRRHKYWPFKSLKAELKQPEAYLKQTLEIVAHLVKSGDFAMTWELKPEARESNYADAMAYQEAKEELPPTAGYNFDEVSEGDATGTDNDADDANVTFESVV